MRADGMVSRRSALVTPAGLAALATGCSSSASSPSSRPAGWEVGSFASAEPGSVNIYWMHAPHGLILVDALRTISDARCALAQIRKTGRQVAGILVTHSHPDHVGGLGVLHEAYPAAPIYASSTTAPIMRTDPLGFYALAALKTAIESRSGGGDG